MLRKIIIGHLKLVAKIIADNVPEPYDHATSALLTAMVDWVIANKTPSQ